MQSFATNLSLHTVPNAQQVQGKSAVYSAADCSPPLMSKAVLPPTAALKHTRPICVVR